MGPAVPGYQGQAPQYQAPMALPAHHAPMGPAVPGYQGQAPQYQAPMALPYGINVVPLPRGRTKPKAKRYGGTKEVLNIPPPILEYFDVKNDPHFIRAPKHQPKK